MDGAHYSRCFMVILLCSITKYMWLDDTENTNVVTPQLPAGLRGTFQLYSGNQLLLLPRYTSHINMVCVDDRF